MSNDTRQLTCEERIDAHLASRLDRFRTIMRIAASEPDDEIEVEEDDDFRGEYDSPEAAEDAWYELPLAVDTKLKVTVTLSTGGPGDQFECDVDLEDGAIDRITYRFLDWFDGATRAVTGNDSDVAEQFLSRFVEGAVETIKHGQRDRGW